ncbi:endo alpha-1,4 polygalactosaminidase [Microbacterium pumilum]|uniref:Endo alpha-1,4 polygalactosaminidase n=1 Tax=Microbacterium pumilum TaxID=344165 RepID=A0ABP5DTC7_9MICO
MQPLRRNQATLRRPRGVALALAAGALVAGAFAAVLLLPNTTLAPEPGVALPPADGPFSYQLGGAYQPEPGVQVLSRDRLAPPAAGLYNICYVNLLQTQPDEPGQSSTHPPYGTTQWWRNNHPGLLLKDSTGQVIVDAEWNEALFDVRTAVSRDQLLDVQSAWFSECKDDGFQAIEPDNLDAHLRSSGLLTFIDTRDYLELVVPYVHSLGLAIAQKNAADRPDGYGGIGRTFVSDTEGFDFAIAEECAAYLECEKYTSVYGPLVYEIEYADNNPDQVRTGVTASAYDWICHDDGAARSIILRDRDVAPAGALGYRYAEC